MKLALEDYNRAVRIKPKESIYYLNRATVFASLGNDEKAFADYDKSIELDPKCGLCYALRGELYGKTNTELALNDLNKAISLDKKISGAYFNRARILAKLSDTEKAVIDYHTAIVLNPNCGLCYNNRGAIYFEKGGRKNLLRAISDYNNAVNLLPTDTTILMNRAAAYERMGNQKMTKADRDKAHELWQAADSKK